MKLHPRVEDYGVIAGETKRTVSIVGIDVFSEQALKSTSARVATLSDLDLSDCVWLTSGLGFKSGDSIRLLINDNASDFTVAGVLDDRAGEAVLMDLAAATRLFRWGGKLDRILIEAPSTHSMEEWVELLRKAFPKASPSPGRARKPMRTAACSKLFVGICACSALFHSQ